MQEQTNWTLEPFDRNSRFFDETLRLYNASFPDNERKPMQMILDGLAQKKMECFLFTRKDQLGGLAFFVLGEDLDILDYLAIHDDLRDQGLGSMLLQKLMKERNNPFIVEIESTLHHPTDQALRRKQFYLRNGMTDCHTGIVLFGVPMELLSSTKPVSYEQYRQVLGAYFGRPLGSNLQKDND